MQTKSLVQDFTEGNVIKQLILFAAPLFFSNMLQAVYNMVDMMIVGQFYGENGLSAISIGGDITNFLTFLSIGFSNAGQVILAQIIGSKQMEKAGRFVGTMAAFLTMIAAILMVFGILFRSALLTFMHTPAACWDDAMAYSVTCMAGLLFIYGYNIVGGILRGLGDSRHPFLFISLAAVMNIFLDVLFVSRLHLGAFGAALATVISQTFSFFCSLLFLYRQRKKLGFTINLSCFRMDREMLAALLKLGIPMAIKQSAVQFSKLFVNSSINAYGVTVAAVAGIASKLNTFSNLISNAFNTAASSMVGQNIGAKKYGRVPKIILATGGITGCFALLLIGLIHFFPEQIFLLFTSDRNILSVAMEFVPVAYLIFIGSACRAPMNALINGSGGFKVNFATAVLDGVVLRIGLAVLLGVSFGMGYLGFWYGDAFAGFTPLWIGIIYYAAGAWKRSGTLIKKS